MSAAREPFHLHGTHNRFPSGPGLYVTACSNPRMTELLW